MDPKPTVEVIARFSTTKVVVIFALFGAVCVWFYLLPLQYESWDVFQHSVRRAGFWLYLAPFIGPAWVVALILTVRSRVRGRGAAITRRGNVLRLATPAGDWFYLDRLVAVGPGDGEGEIFLEDDQGARHVYSVSMMEGSRAEIVERLKALIGGRAPDATGGRDGPG